MSTQLPRTLPELWGGAGAGSARGLVFLEAMESRNHCFNAWVTKSRLKMSPRVTLPASTLNISLDMHIY